jgi:hypothetical protein
LPPEQFFSYPAVVTITGDRAANLGLCLALIAFSYEGSFSCHCDMGPQFIWSHLKDRHPCPTLVFEPGMQGSPDLCSSTLTTAPRGQHNIALNITSVNMMMYLIFWVALMGMLHRPKHSNLVGIFMSLLITLVYIIRHKTNACWSISRLQQRYLLYEFDRTQKIRWSYVVSNLGQVLACTFFIYYIFERFLVPVFRNFGREHLTAKAVILSVFGSMLPATLVLVLGEFFYDIYL